MPAGTSQERTPSRISKTESAKSATSPQVTDLAEEELAEDQPKPLYVSYTQLCIKQKDKNKLYWNVLKCFTIFKK